MSVNISTLNCCVVHSLQSGKLEVSMCPVYMLILVIEVPCSHFLHRLIRQQ